MVEDLVSAGISLPKYPLIKREFLHLYYFYSRYIRMFWIDQQIIISRSDSRRNLQYTILIIRHKLIANGLCRDWMRKHIPIRWQIGHAASHPCHRSSAQC